ncbi:hypothetical protein GCM10027456_19130 [Kineosporia babensis]
MHTPPLPGSLAGRILRKAVPLEETWRPAGAEAKVMTGRRVSLLLSVAPGCVTRTAGSPDVMLPDGKALSAVMLARSPVERRVA